MGLTATAWSSTQQPTGFFLRLRSLETIMNTLLSCTFNNCQSLFKNVYDFVSHIENIHMPNGDSTRIDDIDELERSIRESKDEVDSNRLQERLSALCNHPLRLSGFFRLNPYQSGYTASPAEKKPITLQFVNYRKRPSQHPNPTTTAAKRVAPVKTAELSDSKSAENDLEMRKYHCTVENCKRSYKNSSGLRNHLRGVHNISSQQSNRTSTAAANPPSAVQQSVNSTHGLPPPKLMDSKVQLQLGKPEEAVLNGTSVVGSLATFNSPTNRMTSAENVINSTPVSTPTIRSGLRLTPSEENILNRNLTSLSPSTLSRNTPVPSLVTTNLSRSTDGKFKCEYCPKTYKTGPNLRKHIAEHHTRSNFGDDAESPTTLRTVLSKNALRASAYPGNQLTVSSNSQLGTTSTMSSVKSVLMSSSQRSPSHQSSNLSAANYFAVQSPTTQRQLAVSSSHQPGGAPLSQRTYIPSRTYTAINPAQGQTIQSTGQSAVYHLQHAAQSSSDEPSTLTVTSQAHSSSPRNYGASPVTIVVQSSQPSSSVASSVVQQSHLINDSQYQAGGLAASRSTARTYTTAQPYYERYQSQAPRRGANKAYSGGAFYQQKSVKQLYRQPLNHEYQRVLPTSSASQPASRGNTISGGGQMIRISALPSQQGGTTSVSAGSQSSATVSYQPRGNLEGPRRTSQGGASNLSAQLTPLNIAGQHGGNSTSVDGIQITKLGAPQYNSTRANVFRSGSQTTTIRGRLPEGYRTAQPASASYNSPAGQGRYNQAPYPQRIMRVVQTQPSYAHGNSSVSGQDPLIIQRVIHQSARARHENDNR